MVAPAPAPKANSVQKKTIDECLAEFHGCMTTSTLAPAPRAAPVRAAPRAPAPAATAMSLATSSSVPTWAKPGYKLITTSTLPRQFKLKNAATNQYWIGGDGKLGEGAGTPLVISATSPADIYKVSGTDMVALGTPFGSVRHSGYIMWTQPYTANNFDFAWKLLLKDGTTNRVIIWNAYPGNGTGMYVTGGSRPKIDAGPPTEYIIEPVVAGSGTSGYAIEGAPFGGVVGTGRNTKLILTLLVLAILLWILAKKM
jgi:hypothetical protein